jgi:hypothetical protein
MTYQESLGCSRDEKKKNELAFIKNPKGAVTHVPKGSIYLY